MALGATTEFTDLMLFRFY